MGRINLLNKLKTTAIGLGFLSLSLISNGQQDYQPKYDNLTYKIIELEKENPNTGNYISNKTLDKIIDESKKIITKKNYSEKEAKQLMKKLDSLILKPLSDMDTTISCYYKSMTIYAIAKENNLPIYPVITPNHMFLRWDPDGEHEALSDPNNSINKGDFNWESLMSKSFGDGKYYYLKPTGIKAVDEGYYLKDLKGKELLAVIYLQEAAVLIKQKKYQNSLKYLNKIEKLNYIHPEIYSDKGVCFSGIAQETNNKEYYKKAIEEFSKSQKLNENSDNYFWIGFNKSLLGKTFEAIEDYTKALEMSPDDAVIRLARYSLYEKTNQKKKAEEEYKKIKDQLKN